MHRLDGTIRTASLSFAAPQTVQNGARRNRSSPRWCCKTAGFRGIWDVQWIPNVGADGRGEYWALICAYPKGGGSNHTDLFFAKSADGELWTTYPNPILSPRSGQWDQNFIYRSSFTYDADGKLSVWYSGGKEQPGNHWQHCLHGV